MRFIAASGMSRIRSGFARYWSGSGFAAVQAARG
jgi:hypothetical protein